MIRTYNEHTQQSYKNSRFLESKNFPFDILTSRRGCPQAVMWCGRYVPSTALVTSGACASRWLPADSSALPAAPGDIWKQRVPGGAKNRNARRPTGGLQPVGQGVSHRRQPPQRPLRPPGAARQLPADAPAPREPTPVRPDLVHQFPVFQAALPSSRGETYLRQRGGILRCRRVTARCGCAMARSMRWRCCPLGWQPGSHLQRPGLAVGLGTTCARSGVGARRGHHRAAAVTSALARPHCRGIASPC